jgi:hypothetical protein
VVEDNVFAANTATEAGGARFCFFYGPIPAPLVRRNAFFDNEAPGKYGKGGGIALYDADPAISNCTLDGNAAGAIGGGFYAAQCTGVPTLANTIVTNSTSGGGIAVESAVVTTSRCDVWNNAGGDYINCTAAPDDISANPQFCDLPNRNLTLRDDSPCLPENNEWGELIGAYGAGTCATSVHAEPDAEVLFCLDAPYPNPAHGSVTIRYTLLEPGASVEILIVSVGGRVVRRLEASPRAAGEHRLVWDGTDEDGRPVASGVYLVRGSAAGRNSHRGIVILGRERRNS